MHCTRRAAGLSAQPTETRIPFRDTTGHRLPLQQRFLSGKVKSPGRWRSRTQASDLMWPLI
jgi:hypothetical protein